MAGSVKHKFIFQAEFLPDIALIVHVIYCSYSHLLQWRSVREWINWLSELHLVKIVLVANNQLLFDAALHKEYTQ